MVISQKKIMRGVMKERRSLLFQHQPDAGEKIVPLFCGFFDLPSKVIIGGYSPIGSELDIRPLLSKIIGKSHICALPCMTPEGLTFRQWTSSTPLEKGIFQVLEPPLSAPVVFPDILFVPLLAFDKEGHRLGYGQGHYDRYLSQHKTLTIGVGFKGQEVEHIPRQSHDFALNYILTEEGVISTLTQR